MGTRTPARPEPLSGSARTEDRRQRPVPAETLPGENAVFAITPPWRKRVHLDPEYREPTDLARRHPQGAVQADRLAVQHRVLDDLDGELRVLLGAAEPGGEGHARAERLALLLGQRGSSGVSNRPGAIVITRMPRLARSRAAGRVSPTTPPLEAA